MIIDSHTHVDEVEAWGWIDPPEVLLPLLDEAGIDQAIIMTYRDATGPDDPATARALEWLRGLGMRRGAGGNLVFLLCFHGFDTGRQHSLLPLRIRAADACVNIKSG